MLQEKIKEINLEVKDELIKLYIKYGLNMD